MYILDFFRNLIRRSNTYVIIYLILNLLFITLVTHILFGQQDLLVSFFIAMILYTISLAVALSPVGEWILRKQIGAHEIKRMDYKEYFDPIFQDVYAKAKLADPSLPNDIKLFMSNDKSPNAFATGRKTVCLTEGIVDKPVDELKAVLAHEFGHLSHRDTDVLLVVIVGNFIFSALITFLKVIITIIGFFLSLSERRFRYVITSTLTVVTINFLMWAWTKIGTILIMKSSRENEFEADRFASNLGYGNALCALLDSFGTSDEKGLFALLASSHPDTNERIFRLQELGATYRSNRFSNIPNQNVQMQQGIPTNSQQTFQQQNNFGNQQQFQNGQAYQQQAAPINQGQFLHNGQVQQHNFPNQGQFQHNGQVQQHNFPNQGQFQHNGQAYQQQATPINQGQFLHNGQVQQHNFP
ncbi:MAG: M48 family metalloprotease, partial [Gemella sp.]|nr:M48 family metalloprotease [Gemella sp.]